MLLATFVASFAVLQCIAGSDAAVTKPTLRVATVLTEPFVMLAKDTAAPGAKYHGFIIDILDRLSALLNVDFAIHLPKDNSRYGIKDSQTGEWNGLIGEVSKNVEADIAMADLTVTPQREEVVDFTTPFMTTGITILYKKTTDGSVPFKNVEELLSHGEIKIGVPANGTTMLFFKDTNDAKYGKVWKKINDDNGITANIDDGIAKVKQGNFAFIMEGAPADYAVSKNCDLVTVGGLLNSREYAVATKKGSEWREKIGNAILKLKEDGTINKLQAKWWKSQCETGATKGESKTLRVTTHLVTPFVMLAKDSAASGAKYEGYLIDILNNATSDCNVKYEIHEVKDHKYGQQDSQTGEWSGMIGELVRNADIALADLTITPSRIRFVDFSTPFMTTGITILYKKKSDGSVPFKDVQELLTHAEIKFGTLDHSSLTEFFKDTKDPACGEIWKKMSSDPSALLSSTDEGIAKVLLGGFAFFIEQADADEVLAKYCDLVTVGGFLNEVEYAVAVRTGSEWREKFTSAIIKMKSDGSLLKLREKWWTKKNC